MTDQNRYIRRCIEIAKNGLGNTSPNPMVGCVIVHNNMIIGEGYTSPYGGNHAEVNAINSVTNKALLKEASLYVTLEPCSHFGKTPPCSDLIIRHQIPNVIIGCIDDNEKVAGKGIEKLRRSGCKVVVGVFLEDECKNHHKRFFTFHNKKRPYIILKWAETVDGFIAPKSRKKQEPVWISNQISRQLTHKWRAEEHAILVGFNTVAHDNPSLTTRDWLGSNPVRVVIDKNALLSKNYRIFNKDAKTIRITNKDINFSEHVGQQICDILYTQHITSIIIEGGLKTLQTFIDENLWDEARIFKGTNHFKSGVMAPVISGTLITEKQIGTDTFKQYRND